LHHNPFSQPFALIRGLVGNIAKKSG